MGITSDAQGHKWSLGPGFFSRWATLASSFLVNAFNLYR